MVDVLETLEAPSPHASKESAMGRGGKALRTSLSAVEAQKLQLGSEVWDTTARRTCLNSRHLAEKLRDSGK